MDEAPRRLFHQPGYARRLCQRGRALGGRGRGEADRRWRDLSLRQGPARSQHSHRSVDAAAGAGQERDGSRHAVRVAREPEEARHLSELGQRPRKKALDALEGFLLGSPCSAHAARSTNAFRSFHSLSKRVLVESQVLADAVSIVFQSLAKASRWLRICASCTLRSAFFLPVE